MMRVRKTRRRSAWCPPYAIRDGRDHADIAGTYCGNAVERYKKYGTRQREWGGKWCVALQPAVFCMPTCGKYIKKRASWPPHFVLCLPVTMLIMSGVKALITFYFLLVASITEVFISRTLSRFIFST